MGDLELRQQALGRRGNQTGKRRFVPRHVTLFRRLAADEFLAAGLAFEREVLDDVLRGLRDDVSDVVVALAPGASADLVEIARAEDGGFLAVVLAQPGEQNGADGHVDADPERVRAADDFEQAALRQLLDQHTVLRQQAGMVQADAVPQPTLDFGSVRAAEPVAFQRLGNRGLFLAGGKRQAGEILRALGGGGLREVHHVHRRPSRRRRGPRRSARAASRVLEIQRHGAERRADGDGGFAVETGQFFLEERGVAERGGHEEETRLREREERDLPRAAPVAVAVVMKLVQDHIVDVGACTFAERHVGEDFGGAAEDAARRG